MRIRRLVTAGLPAAYTGGIDAAGDPAVRDQARRMLR